MQVVVVTEAPESKVSIQDIANELEAIQACVRGYVQLVRWQRYVILVNEDGPMRGMRFNPIISKVFERTVAPDGIVGPVVVLKQRGTEFAGLTDAECRDVKKLLGAA